MPKALIVPNGDDESWIIYGAVLIAAVVALGVFAIYAIRHLHF